MSDKILNPKTGKWVLKTGKIGKLLLQTIKTKEGGTSSTKGTKTCNPEVAKYKFNPNLYICNPLTGNWVLKSGDIGKVLVAAKSPKLPVKSKPKSQPKVKTPVKSKSKSPVKFKGKSPPPPSCNPNNAKYKANPNLYICNPKTNNWVLKTSNRGILLEAQQHVKSPTAYKAVIKQILDEIKFKNFPDILGDHSYILFYITKDCIIPPKAIELQLKWGYEANTKNPQYNTIQKYMAGDELSSVVEKMMNFVGDCVYQIDIFYNNKLTTVYNK